MTDVSTIGVCPLPRTDYDRVQLGHGSGGKMSAALLEDRFLPRFGNAALNQLGDGAVVPVNGGHVAISTDTFVVRPLEFPGGNIGSLAVHGTLNDVAMMGATPLYLSAGFILEEGLPFDILDRVLETMSAAANAAGVPIVTGDTKVVERGGADGMFINTTGVGTLHESFRPSPERAQPGDRIIFSGPIARHGIAVMAARDQLGFEVDIASDTANLSPLVDLLREAAGDAVHVMRDPTRGGPASTLNEIARAAATGVVLEDTLLPVEEPVAAACEMLGLDPLYVASEGVLIAIVSEPYGQRALDALRAHELGREATMVGVVTADHPGLVVSKTALGSTRVVDMLPGDQLPRIC